MKGDLLGIIEAAYTPASSESEWLAGLVAAAAPVMDEGLGLYAHTYAVQADGSVRVPTQQGPHGPASEEFRLVAEQAILSIRDFVPQLYPRVPTAGFATQLTGTPIWRFTPLEPRANDALGVVGGNPSGHGVVLHSCAKAPGRLAAGETRLYTHVAAHFAAGLRLQQASSSTDAVLTPSGRVEHAEGAATHASQRAALGDAVRAMDRARGKMRRAAPAEALELWRSLVSGQWSLVEQLDTDGRRYLFARRNAPEVRAWRDLTERERQVLAYASEGQPHKMIAYELGIGVSTVASHLRNAVRKLGVRSRLELVRLYKRTWREGDP